MIWKHKLFIKLKCQLAKGLNFINKRLLPMTKTKEIDQTKFEKLLVWLNADRDKAGQKYESIRQRLIYIFRQRGCSTPEDLADETIDRVIQKIEKLVEDY